MNGILKPNQEVKRVSQKYIAQFYPIDTINPLVNAWLKLRHNMRSSFQRQLSKIEFQDWHPAWMDTITTLNLNTRYDSYKLEFYKKCTLDYTTEWIKNIKELRAWIKIKL